MKQPALAKYIETEFGNMDNVYLDILGDFFRHGYVVQGWYDIWNSFVLFSSASTGRARIILLTPGLALMVV